MDRSDSHHTAIVVADDEEAVLTLVSSMLEKAGFDVVSASDAQTAVERCRHGKTPVDLAVVDIAAAGLDAVEVERQFRDVSPRMRMLFLCAEAPETPDAAFPAPGHYFLRKPFRRSKLLGQISELMAPRRALTA